MASHAILSNFFDEKWTQNHPQYFSGLSRPLLRPTFLEMPVNNIGSFFHGACIVYRVIEALKSYESTQIKSQNGRPSPEIPHEPRKFAGPRAGLWRWGGAGCSKNSTDGYFDGTAWNPRLRSPTPIMASGAKESLSTQIISTAVDDRLVRITRRFQITQEAWKNDSVKVSGQRGT